MKELLREETLTVVGSGVAQYDWVGDGVCIALCVTMGVGIGMGVGSLMPAGTFVFTNIEIVVSEIAFPMLGAFLGIESGAFFAAFVVNKKHESSMGTKM